MTTQKAIEQRPDVVEGAVRALIGAQQALKRDPARATEAAKKLFPAAEADLIAELIRRDAPFYDPTISARSVEALNEFSRNLGLLSAAPAYERGRGNPVPVSLA